MATKIKHVPHVKVLNKKYAQNKEYILAILEITEGDYHELQFETAERWIRASLWNADDIVSYLSSLPEFWAWFINLWNIRDDQFIHDQLDAIINPKVPVELLKGLYKCINNEKEIKGILPDNILRLLFKWAK